MKKENNQNSYFDYFDTWKWTSKQSKQIILSKKSLYSGHTLARIFADKLVPIGLKHKKIFNKFQSKIVVSDRICGVQITKSKRSEISYLGPFKWAYTANKFGLMYSRKRISQNSFPNFIYIFPKSFMIF